MVIFKKPIVIISIVIVLLLILSLYFFIDPSSTALFPKCPFLKFTGLYCPGCGSQRAFHNILKGNIITGIKHNYLFLLAFSVIGYQLIIFVINKYSSNTYQNLLHKSSITRAILIIVVLFWILRNIPYSPFTTLAP